MGAMDIGDSVRTEHWGKDDIHNASIYLWHETPNSPDTLNICELYEDWKVFFCMIFIVKCILKSVTH